MVVGAFEDVLIPDWFDVVTSTMVLDESQLGVVASVKATYNSITVGMLMSGFHGSYELPTLRNFIRETLVVETGSTMIGLGLSLALATSIIAKPEVVTPTSTVRKKPLALRCVSLYFRHLFLLISATTAHLDPSDCHFIMQDANSLQRYNNELIAVAGVYRANVSLASGFVPWRGHGTDEETLLTQFQIPTYGATSVFNNCTLFHKNSLMYARCALCVQDINLSQRQRVSSDSITASSLAHVAQHASSRSHQQARLAYLRGIRDTLKHIAYNGLAPGAYQSIVKDCQRIETRLRDTMKSPSTSAPPMVTDGGPTPSTTKALSNLFAQST
jgi:hypothetical protein